MIRKVLIVDDSPIAIRILKACLPSGFDAACFEARDGAEGVACFKKIKPDLTFLDLTMPVMDGFEALEEMMKIDQNAVVIIVSADIQKKVFEKVASMGAFLMLHKPPSKEVIQSAIEKATAQIREVRV
ncbi:MAG: response regulator [Nitrospiria bacterium]